MGIDQVVGGGGPYTLHRRLSRGTTVFLYLSLFERKGSSFKKKQVGGDEGRIERYYE
jgi:hypothetical protein